MPIPAASDLDSATHAPARAFGDVPPMLVALALASGAFAAAAGGSPTGNTVVDTVIIVIVSY